jgi:NAD(P)-dependent dehydrogenase (short-subunit alcohol dehydrogenase family)
VQGKTVLITGANTGIGRVTAEDLARRGAHVFLAGRSEERTRPVIEAIEAAGGKATFLALELDDLSSVSACAKSYLAKNTSLDVLINNAGLAGQRGLTKQGFELAFGTNHVGHFLLTKLLLPALRESPAARIVNVASGSHRQAKGIDFEAVRRKTVSVSGVPEYGVSKLANVLFAREFARAAISPGILSVSLHPGVIASDVWRSVPWPFRALMKLFMLSVEEGARTTIHCATTADLEDGAYYDKSQPKHPSRTAQDEALAAELWRRSEEWVAPFV